MLISKKDKDQGHNKRLFSFYINPFGYGNVGSMINKMLVPEFVCDIQLYMIKEKQANILSRYDHRYTVYS